MPDLTPDAIDVEPQRYPALLGVSCDGEDPTDPEGECPSVLEADFLVSADDTRATRLGYVLDHACTQGWTIVGRHHPESAMTYCPTHHPQGQAFAAEIAAIRAQANASRTP